MKAKTAIGIGLRQRAVLSSVVAALAVTLLSSGVLAFWWWPAASEEQRLTAQLLAARAQLTQELRQQEMAERYAALARDLGRADAKLDERVGQAALVAMLEELARSQKVRILGQSYSESARSAGLASVYLDWEGQGDYHGLMRFLLGIVRLPALAVIEEASLVPSRTAPGQVHAKLRIAVHYRPEGAPT